MSTLRSKWTTACAASIGTQFSCILEPPLQHSWRPPTSSCYLLQVTMAKPGPAGATSVDKIYFERRDVTMFEGLGGFLHTIHSAVGVSSVSG